MDVTDPDVYEELHQYVDLANLADYSLLHFYADAEDWPHHNGYAAVNPVSGDGRALVFFVWDQKSSWTSSHGTRSTKIAGWVLSSKSSEPILISGVFLPIEYRGIFFMEVL